MWNQSIGRKIPLVILDVNFFVKTLNQIRNSTVSYALRRNIARGMLHDQEKHCLTSSYYSLCKQDVIIYKLCSFKLDVYLFRLSVIFMMEFQHIFFTVLYHAQSKSVSVNHLFIYLEVKWFQVSDPYQSTMKADFL